MTVKFVAKSGLRTFGGRQETNEQFSRVGQVVETGAGVGNFAQSGFPRNLFLRTLAPDVPDRIASYFKEDLATT